MAVLRAYAAPLPDRWVVVLPAATQRELPGLAWWWTVTAAPLRLDVYVPAPLPDDEPLRLAMVRAWRETAATAVDVPIGSVPGPRGALALALVVWGWLLVIGSGGNQVATLGGLWLGLGWPVMRAWFARSQRRWRATLQDALATLVSQAERAPDLAGAWPLCQVPHPGLADLAALCTESAEVADVLLAQWRRCGTPDLADLRPVYAAHLAAARARVPLPASQARCWPEVQATAPRPPSGPSPAPPGSCARIAAAETPSPSAPPEARAESPQASDTPGTTVAPPFPPEEHDRSL